MEATHNKNMIKIAIPYFSKSGHTRKLAKSIAQGAQSLADHVVLIDVDTIQENDWDQLEQADGVVFGSPTFMGSMAGQFKLFLDESAYRGFWTSEKFLDKLAAGFTVATYPSGDKLNTIIQLSIYAAQHGMIWVNNCGLGSKVSASSEDHNEWGAWLGLAATSIENKSTLISDTDNSCAKQFGRRFAHAVKRWKRGKEAEAEQ